MLVEVSLRPATILQDSYQVYARNPFLDPLHPAGYGLILKLLGEVTHNMNAVILLQHGSAFITALLLFAATRRITSSDWAGLLPAGMILLSGDLVFLEHSVMSESWAILAVTIALYSTVRALDDPAPWWRWPALAGASVAAATMIRSDSLPLLIVMLIALVLGRPRTGMAPLRRWQAPVSALAAAGTVLLAFSGANAAWGTRFGIEPSPGWYLYTRVAQFADCRRFTPPPGTESLCHVSPGTQRQSAYYYQEVPARSPGLRLTGEFGEEDALIGSWARRALRAQFGDYLKLGWVYFRGYFVPSATPRQLRNGIDPQLDFTSSGNSIFDIANQQALEAWFGHFSYRRHHTGLLVLRRWQLIIRFGSTMLVATTILTLLGLLVGSRRSRLGVLLFGIGGLSLLIAPALNSTYAGRYMIPLAGPLMAAAAIALVELSRTIGTRGAVGRRIHSRTPARR